MPERRSQCLELGMQLNEIMTAIASEDKAAAEVLGVSMDKDENNIVVNISEEASQMYFHPGTGNSLGWILDEIKGADCLSDLRMTVGKMADGSYLVIQQLSEKD